MLGSLRLQEDGVLDGDRKAARGAADDVLGVGGDDEDDAVQTLDIAVDVAKDADVKVDYHVHNIFGDGVDEDPKKDVAEGVPEAITTDAAYDASTPAAQMRNMMELYPIYIQLKNKSKPARSRPQLMVHLNHSQTRDG